MNGWTPTSFAVSAALRAAAAPALVATTLLQEARGQPPAKRIKRSVHHQQQRLQKLCPVCRDRQDGLKSVEATLRALGHCVL